MNRFRVLFVNVGHQTRGMRAVSPPMGLLFLAALTRGNPKARVRIIDQRAENSPYESVVRRAQSWGADLIGLRCLTSDAQLLKDTVDALRITLPQARIIVGGPHACARHAQILQEVAADAAVVGEGEKSFQLILTAIIEGTGRLEAIPGLVWRDTTGEIVTNPGLPPIVDDLDSLPFPAYDLLDVPLYWHNRNMSMIPHRKYLALFTSRGCPYRCNYCHGIFEKKFRACSPERIAAEMKYYHETFGVDDFDILDDVFNLDAFRVARLSDLVRKWGVKINLAFPNGLRADILTEDTVEALAAMGTYYAAMALETGSPRMQKKIGKFLDVNRFLKATALVEKKCIFSLGFFMMGFPGETELEMQATIDAACESRLHTALFFAVTPYPGTRLYNEAFRTQPDRLKSIQYEGSDHSCSMPVNLSDAPDDVFVEYIHKAYRRFYCDPFRLARILRDFPKPAQLPLVSKGFFRLETKSTVHSLEKVHSRRRPELVS